MTVNGEMGMAGATQRDGADAAFRTSIALQPAHARETTAAIPTTRRMEGGKPARGLRRPENLENRFMEDIRVISQ
jgi:hypothetical protein